MVKNMNKEEILQFKEDLSKVKTMKELDLVIGEYQEDELLRFTKDISKAKERINHEFIADLIVKHDVPKVGKKTALSIAQHFKNASTILNTIELGKFADAVKFVKGVSDKLSTNIDETLVQNPSFMFDLVDLKMTGHHIFEDETVHNIKLEQKTIEDLKRDLLEKPKMTVGIKGLNIAYIENDEMSLEEFKSILKNSGANYHKIVITSTNFLVVDDKDAHQDNKLYHRAKAYNIPILTIEEFKAKDNNVVYS